MDQEREVQRLFLSVVVSNEHQWLNILEEVSHTEHASDDGASILLPALYDSLLLLSVQHKVRADHSCLRQYFNVELFFENFLEESHFLGSVESLEIVLCFSNEG